MGRFVKRHGRAWWLGLGVLLAGFSLVTVLAVHDLGIFELDGDASDGAAAGEDWDGVFNGSGSALADVFIGQAVEAMATDVTYFTGGGSKDVNDVNQWAHTSNDVAPDKDQITDAFAGLYQDPNGDSILYFGADRFANSGDAQIGFWFFQEAIGLNPNGSFIGVHSIGDILVLSDFTQGGNISTIRVFRWVGSGGSDGALDLAAQGVDCDMTPPGDVVCATVNHGDSPSPWPYTPKAGSAGTFPIGSFYEGGVNLGALGLGVGCLSSFLAETRSSQSVTAQLKDFALGSFEVCAIDVDKDGDTLSKVGDDVNYTITITNSGALTLYEESIVDNVLGDLTGTEPGCAVLAADDSCVIHVTRTVQAGDPDPLDNTVTVIYNSNAGLTGDTVTLSDSHSVNLFQPAVSVTKTGDTLSKVGDQVTYNFRIDNLSSADAPNLIMNYVLDSRLGNLSPAAAAASCSSLASGASCSFSQSYTVQAGDPDPLINTVSVSFHPNGFPNDISDDDEHSVNLFQPCVEIDKTGDTLSKVGDAVNYTITVHNCSSSDSPNLSCTVSDPLLGLNKNVNLAPGAGNVTNASRVVQAGDPDPLVNTASVTCTVDGFGNTLGPITDSHSVNLFQPGVRVTKSGDTLSKVGDVVNYTIEVCNTSSSDSPSLVKNSVTDSLTGPPLSPGVNAAFGASLASGACESHAFTRTVQAGDPDPLVNTATAHYHPDGFPNDITDDDVHSVNLFTPCVEIDKTGDTLSKVGDAVNYTITVHNCSSSDSPNLSCTVRDPLLGLNKNVNLAPGAGNVTNASRVVQAGDPDPLVNTASVTCTVDGFGNTLGPITDSHSVNLFQPSVRVDKTGVASASVGDTITYSFAITNTGSSDSPALLLDSVTDTVLGTLTAAASAGGCGSLAPGGSCGFTATYTVQVGDPDPLVNVVTVHYHPSGFPNDIADNDDHSVDLIPAGEGCTPGFWKNHTSLWDGGCGGASSADDVTTTIQTCDLFNAVFGVTSTQSGLGNSKTILNALSVSGNLLKNLDRHAAAALVNADSSISFPYSVAQVIALYRDAVGAVAGPETLDSAKAKLEAANQAGCPLN